MPPIDPRMTRNSIQPEGTIAARQVGKPGEFIGGKVELGKTYSEQVGPSDEEAMYSALQQIAGGIKTGLDAFSQIRTNIEEKELGEFELGASKILEDKNLGLQEKKDKFDSFIQNGPKNIWLLEGKKDKLTAGLIRESTRQFKTDENEYVDLAYQRALEAVRKAAPGSAQPSAELLLGELQKDLGFNALLSKDNIPAKTLFNELAFKKNTEDINRKNLELDNLLLSHTIPVEATRDMFSLVEYLKTKYDPNGQTFREIVSAFSTVTSYQGSYELYLSAMLREIGVDKYIETTYGASSEQTLDLFQGKPSELKIRPEDIARIQRIKSVIDKDFEQIYSTRFKEANFQSELKRQLDTETVIRDPKSDITALTNVIDSYRFQSGNNAREYETRLFAGLTARISRIIDNNKNMSWGDAIEKVASEFSTIPNVGFTKKDLLLLLAESPQYKRERASNVDAIAVVRDSDWNETTFKTKIFRMIREAIPVNIEGITAEDINNLVEYAFAGNYDEVIKRSNQLGMSDFMGKIQDEITRWQNTQKQQTEKTEAEQEKDTADTLRVRLAKASPKNEQQARVAIEEAIKPLIGELSPKDPLVKTLIDSMFSEEPDSGTKLLDAAKALGIKPDNLLPLIGIRTEADKQQAQRETAKATRQKALITKLDQYNPDVSKGGKEKSFTYELFHGTVDREVLDTVRTLSGARAILSGKLNPDGTLKVPESDLSEEERLNYTVWQELYTPALDAFINEMDRNYAKFSTIANAVISEVTTSVSPETRQRMMSSYGGDNSPLQQVFNRIIYGSAGPEGGSKLPEKPINENGTWSVEAIQYMAHARFLASHLESGKEYTTALKSFMDEIGRRTASDTIEFFKTDVGKLAIATMLHVGQQVKADGSERLVSSFSPASDAWGQRLVILANVSEARSIEESIAMIESGWTGRTIMVPLIARMINGDRSILPLGEVNGRILPVLTKPQGLIASAFGTQPSYFATEGPNGTFITLGIKTYNPNDPQYSVDTFVGALQDSGILPKNTDGSNALAKEELSQLFRTRLLDTTLYTSETANMSHDDVIREGLRIIYNVTSQDQRIVPDALGLYFSSWGPESNPNFKYVDGEKKSTVFFDMLFTFMDVNQLSNTPGVQLQFRDMGIGKTSGFAYNSTIVRTGTSSTSVGGVNKTRPEYSTLYTYVDPDNPYNSWSGNWFREVGDYYRDADSLGPIETARIPFRKDRGIDVNGDMARLGSLILTETGFSPEQKVSTILGFLRGNGWVNTEEEYNMAVQEAAKYPTLQAYWQAMDLEYGGLLTSNRGYTGGETPIELDQSGQPFISFSYPGNSELQQTPSFRLPTFPFSERNLRGQPFIQISDGLFTQNIIQSMRSRMKGNNDKIDLERKQLEEKRRKELERQSQPFRTGQ